MKISDQLKFLGRDPLKPGAFAGLPFATYQQAHGVNFSALTPFARSPLAAKREQDGKTKREASDAMQLGSALHSLVLEGASDYFVRPKTYGPEGKPWNGNATECKNWLAAHTGKPVLTWSEAEALDRTADYVRSHPKAGPLVKGGCAEVSCFALDAESGLFLKGRLDYVKTDSPDYTVIVDLKRTQDASTTELSKTILFRRYHVQAAMYRRLARANGADCVRHFFIAVEDGGALPLVNVRELNPRAVDFGDEILSAELARYAEAQESGLWPEWSDDAPGVACVDLPEWAYPQAAIEMD